MKVWDVRSLKSAVHVYNDLPSFYGMCVTQLVPTLA